MYKGLLATLLLLIAALMLAKPAPGVFWEHPDGGGHPYVGASTFFDADGEPLPHGCTGTLLSPSVFLVAGHCTDGAADAWVWFGDDIWSAGYPDLESAIHGTPYTHPDYSGGLPPARSDLGIVVLDRPVVRSEYGVLADESTLEELLASREETPVDVVSYAYQNVSFYGVRYAGHGLMHLPSEDGAVTVTNEEPDSTGGGSCFSNSGSPALMRDTNIILAVGSIRPGPGCSDTYLVTRVDTEQAHSFIQPFLETRGSP